MHHSHNLEIKDRHFIYNDNVMKEIELYMDCNVQPTLIQALINKKFLVNSKYNDIYHAMKIIRCSRHENVDLTKCDVNQLIDILENMKKKEPDLKYAYAFESQED